MYIVHCTYINPYYPSHFLSSWSLFLIFCEPINNTCISSVLRNWLRRKKSTLRIHQFYRLTEMRAIALWSKTKYLESTYCSFIYIRFNFSLFYLLTFSLFSLFGRIYLHLVHRAIPNNNSHFTKENTEEKSKNSVKYMEW